MILAVRPLLDFEIPLNSCLALLIAAVRPRALPAVTTAIKVAITPSPLQSSFLVETWYC
jgi:hypothetical protein